VHGLFVRLAVRGAHLERPGGDITENQTKLLDHESVKNGASFGCDFLISGITAELYV
jgi:hypothetical protein